MKSEHRTVTCQTLLAACLVLALDIGINFPVQLAVTVHNWIFDFIIIWSKMPSIEVNADFGYCLAVAVGLYLHQQLVLILPVLKARKA